MQKTKILFFDVDGTLLTDDHKILKENKTELLSQIKKGNIISLATGRSVGMVKNIIDELKLNNWIVLSNGNFVYNPTTKETIAIGNSLNKKVKKHYLKYVKKTKGTIIWFTKNADYMFSLDNRINDVKLFSDSIIDLSSLNFKEIKKQLYKENIYHLTLMRKDSDNFEELTQFFKNKLETKNICKITNVSNKFIDADNIYVNKYEGIKKVIELIGPIDPKNVYCFGDSNNDIEMLDNVFNSVCMDNAKENVKKHAKILIGNNNQPSIAKFIKLNKI